MKISKLCNEDSTVELNVCIDAANAANNAKMIRLSIAERCGLSYKDGDDIVPVLEKKIGADVLLKTITEALMRASAKKVFDEEKIDVVGESSYSAQAPYWEGSSFVYTIHAITCPIVHLCSYENLSVNTKKREVNDVDVDAKLYELLATECPSEPDEAQNTIAENSFVRLSMETKNYGDLCDEYTWESHDYELGRGLMPDGFDEGIIGMVVGEQRKVLYGTPDRTISFLPPYDSEITLEALLKKIVPEASDEWVKNHFETYSTVSELRDGIRKSLDQEAQAEYEENVSAEVLNQLIENIDDEIPQAALEACKNDEELAFGRMLMNERKPREEFLMQINKSEEDLQDEFLRRAKYQLSADVALDAYANHFGLTVSNEDLEKYSHDIIGMPWNEMKTRLENAGGMREFVCQARRMKAHEAAVVAAKANM